MKKGDMVYYARIIPSCDIYEVLDLKVRTIMEEDGWFVGVDDRSKQAKLFDLACIDESVFYNRAEAVKIVNAAEKTHVKRILNKYEEEWG